MKGGRWFGLILGGLIGLSMGGFVSVIACAFIGYLLGIITDAKEL